MNKNFERTNTLSYIQKAFEWDKWRYEIPYINWPSDWLVKAIPPTITGIIRYLITKKGLDSEVSVYLDCYDIAGFYGEPYWEVCPTANDIARCSMKEIDALLKHIGKSLKYLEQKQRDTESEN